MIDFYALKEVDSSIWVMVLNTSSFSMYTKGLAHALNKVLKNQLLPLDEYVHALFFSEIIVVDH